MTNNYKKCTPELRQLRTHKMKLSTNHQDQREYLHDDLKNMFLIPREHYS